MTLGRFLFLFVVIGFFSSTRPQISSFISVWFLILHFFRPKFLFPSFCSLKILLLLVVFVNECFPLLLVYFFNVQILRK